MYCWGNTSNGELGLGGIEEQYVAVPRKCRFEVTGADVVQVACGSNHTLVLTDTGEIHSCGSNDFGQLGHDKSRTKLQLVEGIEAYSMKNIACGEVHSMSLNEWGQVFTWGSDSHGQLGLNGTEEYLSKPKIVRTLATSHVVQIACGYRHCLALTNRGELFSWGCNDSGQLGLGSKQHTIKVPTLVSSLKGLPIAFIACGANHSFVVSKSGAVYGWGKNKFGQLGLNSQVDHLFPCQLKTLRSIRVKYISCGEDFSAFLTQDGGVLTCGSGNYGQLGHGSTSNEILPRKVLELMGSVVTQISCGRRHTLAYIPSREKIYSFGTGGAGQLGLKQLLNCSSPQTVSGPWISENTCRVKKLFAGGDQCFVTTGPYTKEPISDDFRVRPKSSKIWSLNYNKLIECANIAPNESVDQDLLTYIETVLTSLSCINGSFLQSKDAHFCCNSKNHGIDMDASTRTFSVFTRIQNETIKNVVQEGFVQLIQSFVPSPPDIETLRAYIIVPLYYQFDNYRHADVLQGPYAKSFLNLKTEAGKIIGTWFVSMSPDYLDRLVRIYKDVLNVRLKASPVMNVQNQWDLNQCEHVIILALEFLARLNRLNQSKSSQLKVPYENFHMPELLESVDIRVDYVRWVVEDPNNRSGRKYFCHYPFLFDATAKTLLLQTDQTLQMQSAVNEATQRAIANLIFSPVVTPVHTILEIHVSRENLVNDTIRELSNYSEKDFKKPLKVQFLNEEAEDAGGVKKEFFLLLLREVLDPKYGMFTSDPESNEIWFSEVSFEDEIMYYLVGLLCGLAIYNFTIINLPFPLALYKKLLGEPLELSDVTGVSPALAKGLQELLDYEEPDVEDVFCAKFEVTRDHFGEIRTIPLKPGGSDISVTLENKREYVDLYIDYVLNTSIARHFRAFSDAFHKVCGGRVLQLFRAHELMAVVIGNENYDWIEFENNAEYKNGYTSSDPTIRLFWEVFHELPLEEKKKFLTYLTGTDRIPIQGMKAVKILIQPTHDDKYLPVAHTCFNLLDLPRYKTKERLKYKLLQAIQQTQGFSLV